MSICLGIYVEKDFIKYAKVKKEEDNIKILNFNIEFYENLGAAIKKIIFETNSSKIPISINLSDEMYKFFEIDSTLKLKEIKKQIEKKIRQICLTENLKFDLLESRYILRKSSEKNKYTVLNVLVNKLEIKEKKQAFNHKKLNYIMPISTSIINLLEIDKNENVAIVNVENKTNITIIKQGQIHRIETLSEGMIQLIQKIKKYEKFEKNSYNALKKLIIYEKDSESFKENFHNNDEYVKLIIPILSKITTKIKKIIDNPDLNINNVYITGSITNIDNIYLYFQENLNIKCEILKPFFLETTSIKTSIKEYIEVNSAIALALNGLGYLQKNLNFDKQVNLDIKEKFEEPDKKEVEKKHNKKLTSVEKLMLRICMVLVIIMVGLIGISNISYDILEERKNLISKSFEELDKQNLLMDEDLEKITEKTAEYTRVIENIKSLTEAENESENKRIISKFAIPNLLNRIMTYIPEEVKIISIKNEENSKIIFIEAQAEKYEQLGYFSSALKNENVLKNIKSTSGLKEGSVIKVTIEGELP